VPPLLLLLAAVPLLQTVAEQSGFVRTGRYAEVVELCADFARAYPGRVRCDEFGRSPEGRPLLALVASADGTLDPAAARTRRRPVVLVQGGIHAGEIDGKDAGFWLLRELLAGRTRPAALQKVTLVFIPVFNVDGHERWGKNNRPNQNGPEEMGWRATAQNLNLNRDYMKAEAPEMQAMLALLDRWDPILYVDLHVTDGAQFEHDLSVQIEPMYSGFDSLRAEAREIRTALFADLTRAGHLPLAFYPSFEKDDDPASGFEENVTPTRFANGYYPLRNRFAVLVEIHSWKPYRARVKATFDALSGLLAIASRRGPRWLELASAADARGTHLGGGELPVDFAPGPSAAPIDFKGVHYHREPSVMGGEVIRYDPARPEIWRVPLRRDPRPKVVAKVPRAGYLVTAAWAAVVAPKLRLHGVQFEVLEQPGARRKVQALRARTIRFSAHSYEGRQGLHIEGEWRAEVHEVPPGSLFVPIAQVRAPLAIHLLDPGSEDSLLSWGYFNRAFEQKEYIEGYVLEDFARAELRHPAVKAEWEQRLRDPSFAADPAARRDFFYRRHPAYDDRYGLYPVYKLDQAP
jgi:hypothetical protein